MRHIIDGRKKALPADSCRLKSTLHAEHNIRAGQPGRHNSSGKIVPAVLRRHLLMMLLFALLLGLMMNRQAPAQDSLKLLETQLESAGGKEKIVVLTELLRSLRKEAPQQAIAYGTEALSLLKVTPDSRLEHQTHNLLAVAFSRDNQPDSALSHQQMAVQLARELGDRVKLAASLRQLGDIYQKSDDYPQALKVYQETADIFLKIHDQSELAMLWNEMGIVHKNQGNYQQALEFHQKALEICKQIKDQANLGKSYNGIGVVEANLGHYEKAVELFLQALRIWEETGDRNQEAGALTNIGGIEQFLGNREKALEYFERSQAIYRAVGNRGNEAIVLYNVGTLQYELKQYDKALQTCEEALAICESVGNRRLAGFILTTMGDIHLHRNDYKKAHGVYEQSLAILKEIGNRQGVGYTLLSVSEIHRRQGRYREALTYAREALEMSKDLGELRFTRESYKTLSQVQEDLKQYSQALESYKQYKAAHDSLFNTERQSIIEDIQAKYRTQEQQQKIAILQQSQKVQQLWIVILLGGVLLLIIIAIFFYNRYRLRKRENRALEKARLAESEQARLRAETVEAKNRFLQAENERQTRELEEAREFQLSLLPEAVPHFPSLQIEAYMKTATEVGGDYYDFHLCKSGALTILLGDATGHGLKAGMMVAATKSIFSTLADEDDLAVLMKKMNHALKRINLHRLYMGLQVVRIQDGRLELTSAGMPPLLIYRAATGRTEEITLKAFPLGSFASLQYQKYEDTLSPGDTLLMMSDGFPELFNENGEILDYGEVKNRFEAVAPCSPSEIIEHFVQVGKDWTKSDTLLPKDDMTFVVTKVS